MKGCFVCQSGGRLPYVYRDGREEQIRRKLEMPEEIITEKNLDQYRGFLRETEVIFCTWDMLSLTKEQIREYFPKLKVVFYGAASVQYFGRPFLESGVTIVSCWKTMARPVAQFTLAAIVMANKGALMTLRKYRSEGYGCNELVHSVYPGTYGTKVGVLGAGAIGSLVVRGLKEMGVDVMVYDPFLSREKQLALGIDRTYSLEEVFSQCQTISNHLANNARTAGMLNGELFSKMGDTAALINTGRGAQVVEADLIQALREKPLRSAILDVTYPEPVPQDSPLLSMENVFLFPHVAGYARQEVLMFPDFLLEQLEHYQRGEPLTEGIVTLEMLETMA